MEARSAPAIEGGPDLRASLGIPADATVFCRHGGMPTFNVPFVRTAVARFADLVAQTPEIVEFYELSDRAFEKPGR